MIHIQNRIFKNQPNFWNNCLFHPTDAIEDSWGRRILDRMAKDGSIKTIRVYTMMEDIVYLDEDGDLQYDFRVSDLRLDYMIEMGFDPFLTYAGMPDCIAQTTTNKSSVSKGKTRYKGKLFNTSPPKTYELWEEVCYQYTKHILERYGLERVRNWRLQCYNEPDNPQFWMGEIPQPVVAPRVAEYCKLYESFTKGVCRASKELTIGGPTLAGINEFLERFLDYVKENALRLDFISVHNYGTFPNFINDGSRPISVSNQLKIHREYVDIIEKKGFSHLPLVVDEWGMSTHGFFNREECPDLICRETEVFSSYFAKLIHQFLYADFKIDKLMICLSGQHEMVEDFTGFRNFFTLNFIAKPIYNAYILASKLKETILYAKTENENIFAIPTKDENGNYSILLSYSSEYFDDSLPPIDETLAFEEDLIGKRMKIYCIDKTHTNPYRLSQQEGKSEPNEENIRLWREEGKLKPVSESVYDPSAPITLHLTPNSTFLITLGEEKEN